jgi:hypothetical protein
MSPNRVVALLTPLVFAPAAGAVATWLARHFPGVRVSPGDLQSIFIAGALIALAPAAQWLHGWQKWEAQNAETERAVEVATIAASAPAAAPLVTQADADDPLAGLDEDDDEEGFVDEQPALAGS